MKELLAFAVCVILALPLTACGREEILQTNDFRPSSSAHERTSSPAEETGPVPEEENSTSQGPVPIPSQPASTDEKEEAEIKWTVQVGGQTFTATPENNAAAEALTEMMREAPVLVRASDYSGFEKVGPLEKSLPTENIQTTAQAGDIVLYQGNQIVLFYGSNFWSYTRLGRIDDLTGWEEALGSGDVTVSFSIKESLKGAV